MASSCRRPAGRAWPTPSTVGSSISRPGSPSRSPAVLSVALPVLEPGLAGGGRTGRRRRSVFGHRRSTNARAWPTAGPDALPPVAEQGERAAARTASRLLDRGLGRLPLDRQLAPAVDSTASRRRRSRPGAATTWAAPSRGPGSLHARAPLAGVRVVPGLERRASARRSSPPAQPPARYPLSASAVGSMPSQSRAVSHTPTVAHPRSGSGVGPGGVRRPRPLVTQPASGSSGPGLRHRAGACAASRSLPRPAPGCRRVSARTSAERRLAVGGVGWRVAGHPRISRSHTCRGAARSSSPRGNHTPQVPNPGTGPAGRLASGSSSAAERGGQVVGTVPGQVRDAVAERRRGALGHRQQVGGVERQARGPRPSALRPAVLATNVSRPVGVVVQFGQGGVQVRQLVGRRASGRSGAGEHERVTPGVGSVHPGEHPADGVARGRAACRRTPRWPLAKTIHPRRLSRAGSPVWSADWASDSGWRGDLQFRRSRVTNRR